MEVKEVAEYSLPMNNPAKAVKQSIAGFRPRTTRHFSFGKSAQNHSRPCAASSRFLQETNSGFQNRESQIYYNSILLRFPKSQ